MTTTKNPRRPSRRAMLQSQCVLFFSTLDKINPRSVEGWAKQLDDYWSDVSVHGDPDLDADFPIESVGVNFRYTCRSLREKATRLDDQARDALDRVIERLPTVWRRGEQVFSSNFVMGHAVHWKRVLADLAGKPDLHFLEVGSFEGLSCIWQFHHVLTDPSSRMTCVDSFDFGGQLTGDPAKGERVLQDRFDQNIAAAGLAGRVEKKFGYSQIVLRTLPLETYDHVYIDASHLAPDVLEDVVLTYRLLKRGGLATFDDYGWQGHDNPRMRPTMALDAFVDIFEGKVEVVYKGYQLFLRRID